MNLDFLKNNRIMTTLLVISFFVTVFGAFIKCIWITIFGAFISLAMGLYRMYGNTIIKQNIETLKKSDEEIAKKIKSSDDAWGIKRDANGNVTEMNIDWGEY